MKMPGIRNILYLLVMVISVGCKGSASGAAASAGAAENESGHAHEAASGHESMESGAHAGEVVRLTDDERREFGVVLSEAGGGSMDRFLEFPGELVLNADRLAHVVPRVGGVVREVHRNVGDRIDAGEVLATLDSRELAEARSAYLAAAEREDMARSAAGREKKLWELKLISEQEFLDARQALVLAGIARRSARQQLQALGLSDRELGNLTSGKRTSLTLTTMTSPFSGTIIEKHLTLGENVGTDTAAFTIADLSSVWADLQVYQKDLPDLRPEQAVRIDAGHGIEPVSGKLAWVSPRLDPTTRTARARVVLANPDGSLRPGLFVMARVTVGRSAAAVVVPRSALQTFEGRTVVFVSTARGLEPQPVETGRQNETEVEILSGLAPGRSFVSAGAFTVKAQLSKGAFGDGHNH